MTQNRDLDNSENAEQSVKCVMCDQIKVVKIIQLAVPGGSSVLVLWWLWCVFMFCYFC